MKHISILIPKGQYSIVNIAGSYQILNWANDAYFQQSRKQLFQIEFIGYARPAKDFQGYYTVNPPRTIHEVEKTDLIIVPAVHGELAEAIELNREVIQWMAQRYREGTRIAAFCIGAFLLAETGILNGKKCSTHWGHARELQEMFPEIQVQPEKIVTECDGIYSSGGAYAFTNLVIYLIEKYGGRQLALMTAKAFMIDVDKNNQSVFMVFNGQKSHHDKQMLKIQEHIEKNYGENLNTQTLADIFFISRRTLERKFKAATGNSVLEYLQRVRVEAAKQAIESNGQVADAMYAVGYNDSKAFREVFRKFVGITPLEYRKKFSRVSA